MRTKPRTRARIPKLTTPTTTVRTASATAIPAPYSEGEDCGSVEPARPGDRSHQGEEQRKRAPEGRGTIGEPEGRVATHAGNTRSPAGPIRYPLGKARDHVPPREDQPAYEGQHHAHAEADPGQGSHDEGGPDL